GRQYRLKVIKGIKEEVKLIGKYLWVHVSDKDDLHQIKKLIDKWYREHAQNKFTERFEIIFPRFKKEGIKLPLLQLKVMSKRWGSYIFGKIILNIKLVEAPVHCIDYIITHELCHVKNPNHGKTFYQSLNKAMPDWQE